MSDRPARPEWRAAYLNRTLTRRAMRALRVTPAVLDGASTATAAGRIAAPGTTSRRHPAPSDSLPLPIAAMLRLVPSA